MAHFEVINTRSGPNGAPVVLARTRRFNGAVNERDSYVDSARANAIKHAGGARVVVGPVGPSDPNAIDVVTLLEGRDLVERFSIRAKVQD